MIADSYYDVSTQACVVQGKNVRVVLLRQIPEDDNLRRQWNALLERLDDRQVFYTYEWALAVQRAYAHSLMPRVFCAYDEQDALCGVVALAEDASSGGLSFLCATTGDYCDFLSAPADRDAFVAAVLAQLKKENIRNITLTNLPADSPSVSAIRKQVRGLGYHRFQRLAYVCAQYSMKQLDREQNEKPRVARPKMIRRSLKALASEGPVRFDHARSWNEVEPLLPQFMQAHVARFLVGGRISNTARAERRVFLTELARLLSQSGWLCLTRMMAGAKAVAWNYGFQFHGSWFWYQPTFESEVEKHSPGYCLLARIVDEAAENQFMTVDLGLGAEEYKDRVANQSRETLYVTLKTSAAEHAYEIARYSVAKLVKISPKLERGIRAAGVALRHLKQRTRRIGWRETIGWALQRTRMSLSARDEVFFYEMIRNQPVPVGAPLSLRSIDLDLLAAATMQYIDDEATLAYLLRCAKRLRIKEYAGFALLNKEGEFVHFTWAGPFAGFHWAELNCTLPAPSEDSVVLFDSWTPGTQRGRGYYAPTLALVADRIRQQGKRAWGFSAATNISSVRGLEKMGFPRRFSIVRRKVLGWQWLSQHTAESPIGSEQPAA